ncbi:hypothetical protein [Natrinema salaciae]|uniref:Uncharacterized protein n=1 Tax=Natrinema salaciae TaxID=1186196 RepID=A0A1H9RZZ8_9EURY|nr:hypothetical protein [Natrinema salaciae]SER78248.1 hypothetical protein SAMN04489841_4524 [Natrinema salaciae]
MADSNRLVDLIFEKEQPESVDFEIAFTALIATATLTSISSETEHSLIITLFALSLLVLTLVRRMGVIGKFAEEETILSGTLRLIELLTIVCVLQISTTVLSAVGDWATGTIMVSSVLIVMVLLIVVLQELIFRDYRIWWGSAFFTKGLAVQNGKEETDNPLHGLLLSRLATFHFELAYFILKEPGVIPEKDIEKWNTLHDFVKEMDKDERSHPSMARMFFGSGIILAVGYSTVSLILSFTGFPIVGGLLLLAAIMAVRHLIGFWYLAYGSQSLSRFLQGNTHHLATMGVYGSISYWLFFYVP